MAHDDETSIDPQTIVITILSAARSEKSKTFARLFLHRFLFTVGWKTDSAVRGEVLSHCEPHPDSGPRLPSAVSGIAALCTIEMDACRLRTAHVPSGRPSSLPAGRESMTSQKSLHLKTFL